METWRLFRRAVSVIQMEMMRSWNTVEIIVESGGGERWWYSGCFLKGKPIAFAVTLIWGMHREESRMIPAFGLSNWKNGTTL